MAVNPIQIYPQEVYAERPLAFRAEGSEMAVLQAPGQHVGYGGEFEAQRNFLGAGWNGKESGSERRHDAGPPYRPRNSWPASLRRLHGSILVVCAAKTQPTYQEPLREAPDYGRRMDALA